MIYIKPQNVACSYTFSYTASTLLHNTLTPKRRQQLNKKTAKTNKLR